MTIESRYYFTVKNVVKRSNKIYFYLQYCHFCSSNDLFHSENPPKNISIHSKQFNSPKKNSKQQQIFQSDTQKMILFSAKWLFHESERRRMQKIKAIGCPGGTEGRRVREREEETNAHTYISLEWVDNTIKIIWWINFGLRSEPTKED